MIAHLVGVLGGALELVDRLGQHRRAVLAPLRVLARLRGLILRLLPPQKKNSKNYVRARMRTPYVPRLRACMHVSVHARTGTRAQARAGGRAVGCAGTLSSSLSSLVDARAITI